MGLEEVAGAAIEVNFGFLLESQHIKLHSQMSAGVSPFSCGAAWVQHAFCEP
jgi:hypothetical protein